MILNAFVGNDCVIELYAREPLSDADLSSALAEYELSDSFNQVIDNGAMTYIGVKEIDNLTFYAFRATIQSTLPLTADAAYSCKVSFDDNNGGIAMWTPTVIAKQRT